MKTRNVRDTQYAILNMPFNERVNLLNDIYTLEDLKDYLDFSDKVIKQYEDAYLVFINEMLRDHLEMMMGEIDEEELLQEEHAVLQNYNPRNLVMRIKDIEYPEIRKI